METPVLQEVLNSLVAPQCQRTDGPTCHHASLCCVSTDNSQPDDISLCHGKSIITPACGYKGNGA